MNFPLLKYLCHADIDAFMHGGQDSMKKVKAKAKPLQLVMASDIMNHGQKRE